MVTASLIANKRSGQGALGRDARAALTDMLAERGIHVVRRPRGRISRQIRRSVEDASDIVVVAGGDGTINAAANAHRESGRPIGVVPLGTMNLLARDWALPLDPAAALDVIAAGTVARVPAAELDGRLFLHSAFVGMPVRIGTHREARRDSFGLLDGLRLLWHALRSFRRDPMVEVRPEDDGPAVHGRSLVVTVGSAARHLLPFPRRSPAPAGLLEVVAIRPPTRLAALRVLVRGIAGTLEADRDVSVAMTARARILGPRSRMHAMLDGETTMVSGTALLRAVPAAVPVIVPRGEPSALVEPAARAADAPAEG